MPQSCHLLHVDLDSNVDINIGFHFDVHVDFHADVDVIEINVIFDINVNVDVKVVEVDVEQQVRLQPLQRRDLRLHMAPEAHLRRPKKASARTMTKVGKCSTRWTKWLPK